MQLCMHTLFIYKEQLSIYLAYTPSDSHLRLRVYTVSWAPAARRHACADAGHLPWRASCDGRNGRYFLQRPGANFDLSLRVE